MKPLNKTVQNFGESIFSTMSRLSMEHKALNLSQGFPNFRGPSFLMQLASDHILDPELDKNQYAPSRGILPLREVLGRRYSEDYNLKVCPHEEIVITNGATEGILCSLMAILNPEDEVIVFAPYYDSYLACIEMAGGVPRFATLTAPRFSVLDCGLEGLINEKTKAIIINTPHNPTGRILNQKEQDYLAGLAVKNDLLLISDEVYERLTFDQHQHIPLAAHKDLKDRTITISSAGKTFGLTGWKIGWVVAPPELSHAVHMVHQFTTFSVATPFQWAISEALKRPKDYFQSFKQQYQELRDFFCTGLQQLGLEPFIPEGSYFCLIPTPDTHENDVEYCQFLVKEVGVSAIPCSAFAPGSAKADSLVRFCFAKDRSTLGQALTLLAKNGR